jgi:hypothetical protein
MQVLLNTGPHTDGRKAGPDYLESMGPRRSGTTANGSAG